MTSGDIYTHSADAQEIYDYILQLYVENFKWKILKIRFITAIFSQMTHRMELHLFTDGFTPPVRFGSNRYYKHY